MTMVCILRTGKKPHQYMIYCPGLILNNHYCTLCIDCLINSTYIVWGWHDNVASENVSLSADSLQKNPSRVSHSVSDVGVQNFFTFWPVNHKSYRGTWDNLRVHNFWYKHEQHNYWYKHEQHNFWYKHEQHNFSDINMNNTTSDTNMDNTTFSSTQHMGVAWGAFPFNIKDVPVPHSAQLEHCFCPLRPSLKVPSGHFEHNELDVAVQSLWTLYPVGKNVKVCC